MLSVAFTKLLKPENTFKVSRALQYVKYFGSYACGDERCC